MDITNCFVRSKGTTQPGSDTSTGAACPETSFVSLYAVLHDELLYTRRERPFVHHGIVKQRHATSLNSDHYIVTPCRSLGNERAGDDTSRFK